MNFRALKVGQRLDLFGTVDEALAAVRRTIECAPDVGPLLVQAYRCLAALRELRDTIDELPETTKEDS
jgi:hypothetical protein